MLATIEYRNLGYQDLSQYESLLEAWEAVPTLLSKSTVRRLRFYYLTLCSLNLNFLL